MEQLSPYAYRSFCSCRSRNQLPSIIIQNLQATLILILLCTSASLSRQTCLFVSYRNLSMVKNSPTSSTSSQNYLQQIPFGGFSQLTKTLITPLLTHNGGLVATILYNVSKIPLDTALNPSLPTSHRQLELISVTCNQRPSKSPATLQPEMKLGFPLRLPLPLQSFQVEAVYSSMPHIQRDTSNILQLRNTFLSSFSFILVYKTSAP